MTQKIQKIIDISDKHTDKDQTNIFDVDESAYDETLELDESGKDNLIGVVNIFRDYFEDAIYNLDLKDWDFTITYTTTFNDLDTKTYYEGLPVLEWNFIQDDLSVPFQFILPQTLNDYDTLEELKNDLKPFLDKFEDIMNRVAMVADYYNENVQESYPDISEITCEKK